MNHVIQCRAADTVQSTVLYSTSTATIYSTVLSGILTAKFVIDVVDGWNIT
jgi:hypothetical protein